jgi:membrane protein implicated in regulation of membrane protease activity
MTTSVGFTWADFYLICFAVGFCFSLFSFVFGGARLGRLHVPHFPGHGPHLPQAAGVHVPAGASHALPAGAAPGPAHAPRGGVSPFNPASIAAFLAWFGGTGFLLTRYSALRVGFELLLSMVMGLIGGAIVFFFISRVLMSENENMDPADYEMVGVLGKLSVSIRTGGTGELLYSQMGTRRVCGARSENGEPLEKGSEVVVTRYEKGIAYVRLWSEMSGEEYESAPAEERKGR